MTPKVMKSNSELIGPKKSMNRRMKPTSHRVGAAICSGSTSSVGMASWLVSYSRLLSRIWEGSVGRKARNIDAPALGTHPSPTPPAATPCSAERGER
jgi:hypothetical protein